MSIKVEYSNKESEKEIVGDLVKKFGSYKPKLLIFFASVKFNPKDLSKLMGASFSGTSVIGCSTSGEIVSGKMLKNSVVAMALSSAHVEDVKVEVLENINKGVNVKKVMNSFNKYYGDRLEKDASKMVGLIFTDGLSGSEENVLESLSSETNIPFVGGSAGDDLKFKATYVYANGKAYTNASVLALLQTKNGFATLKTQSFEDTGKKLVATKVDEKKRLVKEFNGMPALEAYAKAIGKPKEEAAGQFMHNPVGLMIENTPYVRSPQRVDKDEMYFYCNIEKGSELKVLSSVDIVKHTKRDLNDKLKEIGKVAGIINFNCILRTLELEQKKQTGSYSDLFKNIPTIGFSTYGESFMCHINQTSVILFIK